MKARKIKIFNSIHKIVASALYNRASFGLGASLLPCIIFGDLASFQVQDIATSKVPVFKG